MHRPQVCSQRLGCGSIPFRRERRCRRDRTRRSRRYGWRGGSSGGWEQRIRRHSGSSYGRNRGLRCGWHSRQPAGWNGWKRRKLVLGPRRHRRYGRERAGGSSAGATTDGGTTDAPVDAGGCTTASDCPGTCKTCLNRACVAVTSADDPDSCAGTCDANGTCRTKQGQTCQTTSGGCVSGTMCSADGYCCDRPCTATCSGTSFVAAGTCSSGTCHPPTAQTCTGNFVCSGTACKINCSQAADCLPDYLCSVGKCVPKCHADTDCSTSQYCVTSSGVCTSKGGIGDACSANAQCSNNNCADGVCCGSTCALGCQACTRAHTGQPDGTCAPRVPAISGPTTPSCAGACPTGYSQCAGGTACSRVAWDFETHPTVTNYDPSDGDWASSDESSFGADALDYQVMPPGRVHGGQWAARVRGNSGIFSAGISVGLCPTGGTLDLRGKTVTFWMYLDGPSTDVCGDPALGCHGCYFSASDASGAQTEAQVSIGTPQFGRWFQTTFTFGSTATSVGTVDLVCDLNPWSGTLYLDDVSIK